MVRWASANSIHFHGIPLQYNIHILYIHTYAYDVRRTYRYTIMKSVG